MWSGAWACPVLLIYPLFTLLAGKILDAEGSLRASREKFATISTT